MAWGAVSGAGTAGNKVAATTIVHTIATNAPPADGILVIRVAADNLSTTTGATNDHQSCVDSQGNSYYKVGEQTFSPTGAAGDGCTVSTWISQLTNGLAITTDTVTVTFSGSVTTKTIIAQFSTVAAGNTWRIAAPPARGTAAASLTGPSTSISGLPNVEHLFISNDGYEAAGGGVFTEDAAYTNSLNRSTTGGAATTNICQMTAMKVVTATSSTHQASYNSAGDWAALLAVIDEVSPRPGPVVAREAMTRAATW